MLLRSQVHAAVLLLLLITPLTWSQETLSDTIETPASIQTVSDKAAGDTSTAKVTTPGSSSESAEQRGKGEGKPGGDKSAGDDAPDPPAGNPSDVHPKAELSSKNTYHINQYKKLPPIGFEIYDRADKKKQVYTASQDSLFSLSGQFLKNGVKLADVSWHFVTSTEITPRLDGFTKDTFKMERKLFDLDITHGFGYSFTYAGLKFRCTQQRFKAWPLFQFQCFWRKDKKKKHDELLVTITHSILAGSIFDWRDCGDLTVTSKLAELEHDHPGTEAMVVLVAFWSVRQYIYQESKHH